MNKKLLPLASLLMLMIFSSCDKDEYLETEEKGKLMISMNDQKEGIKSSELESVTHAIISIDFNGFECEDLVCKRVNVTNNRSGKWTISSMGLNVGSDYEIKRLELQNEDNQTLYAIPVSGSNLASKISNPLGLTFGIEKGENTSLEVEVLSTRGLSSFDFGFLQFANGDRFSVDH